MSLNKRFLALIQFFLNSFQHLQYNCSTVGYLSSQKWDEQNKSFKSYARVNDLYNAGFYPNNSDRRLVQSKVVSLFSSSVATWCHIQFIVIIINDSFSQHSPFKFNFKLIVIMSTFSNSNRNFTLVNAIKKLYQLYRFPPQLP